MANPTIIGLSEDADMEQCHVGDGDGVVILSWPKTLTKEGLEDFERWLKLILRRARRKAGVPVGRLEDVQFEKEDNADCDTK